MIDPDQIPQITADLDAVTAHGQTLKTKGTDLAETGLDVHATWQGLTGFYQAPEATTLFTAMTPVKTKTADIGADLATIGDALITYADTVRPLQQQLTTLRHDAQAFTDTTVDDDDWDMNQHNIDEHNRLLGQTNAAFAAWQAAQRTCANTINALFSGVRYLQDNGDTTHHPNEFGYSTDQLDHAKTLPWGTAVDRDKHWWQDTWDALTSFNQGASQDGPMDDLTSAASLFHLNGGDNFQQSWKGLYELALLTDPTILVSLLAGTPMPDTLGLDRDELTTDYKAMGKGFLVWDEWKTDPARAAGHLTWNLASILVGTKGTGTALKVGEATETASTVSRVSTKVSDVTMDSVKASGENLGNLDSPIKTGADHPAGLSEPDTELPQIPHLDAPQGTHIDAPAAPGGPHEPPKADQPIAADSATPGTPKDRELATVGASTREGSGAADLQPAKPAVHLDRSDISEPHLGSQAPPVPHHPTDTSTGHGPTASHETPGGRHAEPASQHPDQHATTTDHDASSQPHAHEPPLDPTRHEPMPPTHDQPATSHEPTTDTHESGGHSPTGHHEAHSADDHGDPADGGGTDPHRPDAAGRGPGFIRRDDDFSAQLDHTGYRKSHLDAEGNLTPANPAGHIEPYQHILGFRSPATKADSPFSSVSWEEAKTTAKVFGNHEIRIDASRLQHDIHTGKLSGVELLPPEKVQASIQSEIDSRAGRHVDVTMSSTTNPDKVDEFVKSLGLSNNKAKSVKPQIQAMLNTRRDQEWLIRGIVPSEYIEGPYPARGR